MAPQPAVKTTAAKRLLLAAKRSSKNSAVPVGPYDEDSLRAVAAECQGLFRDMEELTAGKEINELPEAVRATLLIHQEAILRNKECALNYLQSRVLALSRLRLEVGLALPQQIRNNMSQLEATLFTQYDDIFSEYMRNIGMDLTAQPTPPKDLYIEVRAKVDCGELVTEHSGIINLTKGSVHHLRASDVQHLINQGLLEHVL